MADAKSDIKKTQSSFSADGNSLAGVYEDKYAYVINPVKVNGYGF